MSNLYYCETFQNGISEEEATFIALIAQAMNTRDVHPEHFENCNRNSPSNEAAKVANKFLDRFGLEDVGEVSFAIDRIDYEDSTYEIVLHFNNELCENPYWICVLLYAFQYVCRKGNRLTFGLRWCSVGDDVTPGAYQGGVMIVSERTIYTSDLDDEIAKFIEKQEYVKTIKTKKSDDAAV